MKKSIFFILFLFTFFLHIACQDTLNDEPRKSQTDNNSIEEKQLISMEDKRLLDDSIQFESTSEESSSVSEQADEHNVIAENIPGRVSQNWATQFELVGAACSAELEAQTVAHITILDDFNRLVQERKLEAVAAFESAMTWNQTNPDKQDQPKSLPVGNLVSENSDFAFSYFNNLIAINRRYDSFNNSSHSFGKGWSFGYDTRVIMGGAPGLNKVLDALRALSLDVDENYTVIQSGNAELIEHVRTCNTMAQSLYELAVEAVEEATANLKKAEAARDDARIESAASLLSESNDKLVLATENSARWESSSNELAYSQLECDLAVTALKTQLSDLSTVLQQQAALTKSNLAKNIYTINSSDPDSLQYTGDGTITLIDTAGRSHLYNIDVDPDFTSNQTYANGEVNYYPEGATTTPQRPSNTFLHLMPDGGYVFTSENRSMYIYDFFGQLQEIRDRNGNAIEFSYMDHELVGISDGFGRTITIKRVDGRITAITDPQQRMFTYDYDENGLLTSHTDAMQRTTAYLYEEGRLTDIISTESAHNHWTYEELDGTFVISSKTDSGGNMTHFRYFPKERRYEYENAEGIIRRTYYNDRNLTEKIETGDGSSVRLTYDDQDFLQSVTDPMGNTDMYEYDANGNLLSHINALLQEERWTYDEWGQPLSHTDLAGFTTQYHYDANGNHTATRFSDNTQVAYQYDDHGLLIGIIDQMGNPVVYEYDSFGYISKAVNQDSLEAQYENDIFGNKLTYIDSWGSVYQYTYNIDGTIKEILNQDNQRVAYTYTPAGQLDTFTDGRGNVTDYDYDANGRVSKEIGPTGIQTEYVYRRDGLLVEKVVDDQHTRYNYNERGFLTEIEESETGRVTQYTYFPSGAQETVTDAGGSVYRYEYTPVGQIKNTWCNDEISSSYSYNSKGQIERISSGNNGSISFQYDSQNRITKVVDALGYAEEYEYGATGEKTGYIDKNGNHWRYTYTKTGKLDSTIDPEGNVTWNIYNEKGLLESVIDADDRATRFEYDTRGRIAKEIFPNGAFVTYAYDNVANTMTVTDERNFSTEYHYDSFDRLIEKVDPYQYRTRYAYDRHHQLVGIENPNGDSYDYGYDDQQRLIMKIDEDGVRREYRYDANGNKVYAGDNTGKGITYTYDHKNRLLSQINEMNEVVAYKYNDAENTKTETIADGKDYLYQYDKMGRIVREVNRGGDEQRFEYDGNGNQIYKRAFDGQEFFYTYDYRNKLTEAVYPDGTSATYAYDKHGNLTAATNSDSSLQFEYDEMNRPVLTRDLAKQNEIAFEYDWAGNRNFVSWNNGERTQRFEYGKVNELIQATDYEGNSVQMVYDALGREIQRIHSGGSTTDKGYTPAGRLQYVRNSSEQSGRLLPSRAYVYDSAGNIDYQINDEGRIQKYEYDAAGRLTHAFYPTFDGRKKELDMQNRLRLGLDSYDRTHTYGLPTIESSEPLQWNAADLLAVEDAFARISSDNTALQYNEPMWQESFYYDDAGNRNYKVNYHGAIKYDYNEANALIKAGNRAYEYDQSGNMVREHIGDKQAVYSYNFNNRVSRIETNSNDFLTWSKTTYALGMEYAYDALDRRISRHYYQHNGIGSNQRDYKYEDSLHFLYAGFDMDVLADLFDTNMQELGPTDIQHHILTPKAEYLRGNGDILSRTDFYGFRNGDTQNNAKNYYHQDIRHSVVAVSQNNGELKGRYDYDAFGNPTKDDFNHINEYGFLGKRYDLATGHFNFGFRDYYPALGAFTTEDPIREGANWYRYCESDPVNHIDALGLANVDPISEAQGIQAHILISAVYAFRIRERRHGQIYLDLPFTHIMGLYAKWPGQDVDGIEGVKKRPDIALHAEDNGNWYIWEIKPKNSYGPGENRYLEGIGQLNDYINLAGMHTEHNAQVLSGFYVGGQRNIPFPALRGRPYAFITVENHREHAGMLYYTIDDGSEEEPQPQARSISERAREAVANDPNIQVPDDFWEPLGSLNSGITQAQNDELTRAFNELSAQDQFHEDMQRVGKWMVVVGVTGLAAPYVAPALSSAEVAISSGVAATGDKVIRVLDSLFSGAESLLGF
ncbi:MAG: hypothetical protein JXR76_07670 [Deltaproteobacteria bacterium]|nr:hypothetical protein [Deltaproteobacteria bacterium]